MNVDLQSHVGRAEVEREALQAHLAVGTDARLFRGRLVEYDGDTRLILSYDGETGASFAIRSRPYEVRRGELVLGDEGSSFSDGFSGRTGPTSDPRAAPHR